jgi:hypothetical protein
MTPAEHEKLQLEMRVLALETICDWLADVLRIHGTDPVSGQQSQWLAPIEKKLRARRAEYATMTMPELHPAESDLRTALFLEAFDESSERLLKLLRG